MTTPLVGVNFKTELQATLDAAETITAITQANPAVVSAAGHTLANGDVVVLTIVGMAQLDKVAARVANIVASTSYELEGVDSTLFATFVSGSGQKVLTWDTLAWATRVSLPNAAPAELDASTLIDIVSQVVYGRPGAQAGNIDGLFQPNDAGMANLRAATAANATRAFRLTWNSGQIGIFNANVAAGQGFEQDQNVISTTSLALSVRGFPSFYAS